MIRIYTDKSFLSEHYRKITFPLLFYYYYLKNEQLRDHYLLTDSISDAEIVIVPVQIEYYFNFKKTAELYAFIDKARQLGKEVWAYTSGDLGLTLNRDVTTFRFGGFDSKLSDNTYIIPAHTADPYDVLNCQMSVLPKSLLPSIGFTGNAHESLWKWIKEFYVQFYYAYHRLKATIPSDVQKFYPSGIKRFRILKKMQSDNRIVTDFIFRKAYRAGVKTEEDRVRTRLEFFQNMHRNPYTFCMRGNGNFSVRFYETLATGRIPVLVNTDSRLALPQIIDWNKHCVVVSEDDPSGDLARFHEKISPDDFEIMQRQNRELWSKYLHTFHYFIGIHEVVKARKSTKTEADEF